MFFLVQYVLPGRTCLLGTDVIDCATAHFRLLLSLMYGDSFLSMQVSPLGQIQLIQSRGSPSEIHYFRMFVWYGGVGWGRDLVVDWMGYYRP